MRKVPEVERASEKELVGDRHRLRVGVDGPQEAGVERSLKNHCKHKVHDHSHSMTCSCLLQEETLGHHTYLTVLI